MKIVNKGKTNDYVYDISLDGTVINALGMNTVSNTDGFNFQMPEEKDFRYTDENPYISRVLGVIMKREKHSQRLRRMWQNSKIYI